MSTEIERVLIIFKTHLDVGFTNYAHSVIERYFSTYIPQAIQLAQRFKEEGGEERFRWTIGSWIIYEYLEQADAEARRVMEQAIAEGDVVWHAMPFTFHTELMDPSLFTFGLSLSQELDQRYGKHTIAAKMTDVPGHTRGMVPLMAEAGIRFLHIGVNAASTPPDVPEIFVWRDVETDSSIVVMYHHDYGDVTLLPGTNEAVAIVMTGDNDGPPSEEDVKKTYTRLRERFPHARLEASTLDDAAEKLWNVRDTLPVITSEIGDTWIHGAGTDPTKMRQYRALLRLRRNWEKTNPNAGFKAFSRRLLMIPEHTWGMDEKTYLADKVTYENDALAEARKTEHVQHFEASWAEQRGYIAESIAQLGNSRREEEAQAALRPPVSRPDLSHYQPHISLTYDAPWGQIRFDGATGAIIGLEETKTGVMWADEQHPLALLGFEAFSAADYERFYGQYIQKREDVQIWATEDFTKPGLPVQEHGFWHPKVTGMFELVNDNDMFSFILFRLQFPEESRRFGPPGEIYLEYHLNRRTPTFEMTLRWFNKPASRLAQAFWLSFCPIVPHPDKWEMHKLGRWISPLDVVSKGTRTLHAVEDEMRYQDENRTFSINTWDAPLVAPGKPSLLDFHNQLPDLSGGMHVNLYNNVWGTNFPMWFEDDAVFRFSVNAISRE